MNNPISFDLKNDNMLIVIHSSLGKDSTTIRLKSPVAEVVAFENAIVVRVDNLDQKNNENVYAYDQRGDLLWQIPKQKYVYEDSPYVRIEKEGEELVARNWDGLVVVIEPSTGKVVTTRESR